MITKVDLELHDRHIRVCRKAEKIEKLEKETLKRYYNPNKDYKKLLQRYYISPGNSKVDSGYSKDWLYGYVACLYGSMIINDIKRYKLNCFIKELK